MLPFAALIDDTYFCVHGGLSPSVKSVDHMMAIQRDVEVPLCGILSDLLWSDPDEVVGTFAPNQRGAGYVSCSLIFSRKSIVTITGIL